MVFWYEGISDSEGPEAGPSQRSVLSVSVGGKGYGSASRDCRNGIPPRDAGRGCAYLREYGDAGKSGGGRSHVQAGLHSSGLDGNSGNLPGGNHREHPDPANRLSLLRPRKYLEEMETAFYLYAGGKPSVDSVKCVLKGNFFYGMMGLSDRAIRKLLANDVASLLFSLLLF